MERDKGRAVVKQKRFVDKLTEEFKVAKSAITPATAELLYEREDSELMRDQRKFMRINATLMYASKRTYPEISFPVVYLASKYNKATEDDYGKAMRIAEYIVGCGDNHSLILARKYLNLTPVIALVKRSATNSSEGMYFNTTSPSSIKSLSQK